MIANKETINRAIEFIKEKIDPEKIYLFGSYAKGTPTENSDLDFLVIKQTSLPKIKRALPLYTLEKTKRVGIPIPIDFIIYTPQEIELKKSESNSLAYEALKTGKLLYDKKS